MQTCTLSVTLSCLTPTPLPSTCCPSRKIAKHGTYTEPSLTELSVLPAGIEEME